jgi:DNA/RNA endonuclease G (NUC1)/PKD repeat protein
MRSSTNRTLRMAAFALVLVACTADRVTAPSSIGGPIGATRELLGAPPAIRISEVHWDNVGTDAGERIEVSGPAGASIEGYRIVLYNGNGGASYEPTRTLHGAIPATCGARGVVFETYPVNGIQNGDPDGIALVDASNNLVEFLSYGGAFTGVGGAANGLLSTQLATASGTLVRESGTTPVGFSLQRNGDGSWQAPAASTFGTCNDDSGVVTPPAAVASVVVSPAAATVVEGGTQPFTATAFDASSQPIAGVSFTWSTSAPAVATVAATGVATALAPGDARITATAANNVAGSAALSVTAAVPYLPPDIRFSEIHYDNLGTDAGEAIEVEGPRNAVLTGWSIVLYDGGTGANFGTAYATVPLTGTLTGTCNARGVISLDFAQIQNGSPDGFALVNEQGELVEFLSYEGSFSATAGPAFGKGASRDIGQVEPGTEAGTSLQRSEDGRTWTKVGGKKPSFGYVNSCPDNPDAPDLSISFTGRLPSDPPIPVGFQDQLFANKTGTTVATWEALTPDLATIDARGVVTSKAPGTASFRATMSDGSARTTTLAMEIGALGDASLYGSNVLFGVPAAGGSDADLLVTRAQYTLSYNKSRGGPNWVAYRLNNANRGDLPGYRCDCFATDPVVTAAGEVGLTTADYTGSGFDRGHMVRSNDRELAHGDQATTYYLSNVVPQWANTNQGRWADLESYLQTVEERAAHPDVYIVTGGRGEASRIAGGRIAVPTHTWKVALVVAHGATPESITKKSDILEVIAVDMPNVQASPRDGNWQASSVTIDSVEKATGYDFFAALPDNVERAVESNDAPPVAAIAGATTGTEGGAMTFSSAGSSDPDAGDAITASWSLRKQGEAAAQPIEATHTFADDGIYTVTLTITDSHGVTDEASLVVTIANAAPTAVIGAPASVVEGSSFAIALQGATDASPVDAASLTYAFDCGDGSGAHASASPSATCATSDDGVRAVRARVLDKDGGFTDYAATVTITNAAPVIDAVSAPAVPTSTGAAVAVSVAFADAGTQDTHTATFAWGDGTTSTVNAASPTLASASHAYAGTGFYTVQVTVTDDDGGTASRNTSVLVVYDAAAGALRGDGWVDEGTDARGRHRDKTQLRIDAAYARGSATPIGRFELRDKDDGVFVRGSSFDWLVVQGQRATVRGSGVLRDGTAVRFVVSANDLFRGDGDERGVGRTRLRDMVRIKVWNAATGAVILDTEPGVDELAAPATALGGGSISVGPDRGRDGEYDR